MAEDQQKNTTEKFTSTARPGYGAGGEGELLHQIAAPDLIEEREKNKKRQKKNTEKSFSSLSMIFVMRSTLFIDSIKRKNKRLFRIFSYIWGMLISLIYAGGLTMICTINYSKLHFPDIVKNHLDKNRIQVEHLRVTDDTLSHIRLTNIKDINNTYSVKYMNLYSSFGDFLRKKVHRLELDKVTIKIKDTGNDVILSPLFPLLLNLKNQQDIAIDMVVIKNGTLEIEGPDYKIPINFSLDAQLNKNEKMSVPLRIKDGNTDLMAHLTIEKEGNTFVWNIKNIKGSTDFFTQKAENLSGSVVLKTKELSPLSLNIKSVFSLGASNKEISLDLNRKKDSFEGSLEYIESLKQDKTNQISSALNLEFQDVKLNSFSNIEANKSIYLNIGTFTHPSFNMTNLQGTINGAIRCKSKRCFVDIEKDSDVTIHNISYKNGINTYINSEPVAFTLTQNPNSFEISTEESLVNFVGKNLNYTGTQKINNHPLYINAKNFEFKTNTINANRSISFSSNALEFKNKTQEIKNANLQIRDIYDADAQFSLISNHIKLMENSIIKEPFSINIHSENGKTQAKAFFANGKIEANFEGTVNLNSGNFQGTLFIPPFELSKIPNLNQTSSLFPNNIENISGKVALYGSIDWKNERQISGPLVLSLQNINFVKGNTKVKNLNSVLSLYSLQPFISQATQDIAIEEIEGAIPLQNITASIKFESQQLRIFALTGSFANIPLVADHTSIQYKTYNNQLYFRNGSFNWQDVNNKLVIPGLTLNGNGSMYLPVEITPESTSIKGGDIKLINTSLKYTGDNQEFKKTFFKIGDEYIIRSGSISVNSKGNNIIDAYINLEGREKEETERNRYRLDKTFNFFDVFKKEESKPVPSNILKLQKQFSNE